MVRATLTREKVLDAALRLADAEGLDGLSMRKLAAGLGVEAMSLYNHVTGKGDLLDGLAARVFEEVPLPPPALPWDERLRLLATGAFAACAAHPHVTRALAAGQANPRSPGALRFIDALLAALLDAGLDERTAARRYRSLIGQIFGAALTRPESPARPPARRAEPVDAWFRRTVTPAEYPSLHRALPALFALDCAPDFTEELHSFLATIRTSAGQRPA